MLGIILSLSLSFKAICIEQNPVKPRRLLLLEQTLNADDLACCRIDKEVLVKTHTPKLWIVFIVKGHSAKDTLDCGLDPLSSVVLLGHSDCESLPVVKMGEYCDSLILVDGNLDAVLICSYLFGDHLANGLIFEFYNGSEALYP